jgi:hypothetical protein
MRHQGYLLQASQRASSTLTSRNEKRLLYKGAANRLDHKRLIKWKVENEK